MRYSEKTYVNLYFYFLVTSLCIARLGRIICHTSESSLSCCKQKTQMFLWRKSSSSSRPHSLKHRYSACQLMLVKLKSRWADLIRNKTTMLHGFLKLTGYYYKFIQNYGLITSCFSNILLSGMMMHLHLLKLFKRH